jgi:P-type E1-E2 ATPase
MIEMTIPGRENIRIENLVCDVNGTLAVDGDLLPGVIDILDRLGHVVSIHLITADTHGRQNSIDVQLKTRAIRINPGNEAEQKLEILRSLDASTCAAIGQGANDALMLKEAALGVCVLSDEGVSAEAAASCDILARDIISALELFENPRRIQATLRR